MRVDDDDVDLTPSEFRLLLLLLDSPGQVFTRGQIMEHLWQSPYIGDAPRVRRPHRQPPTEDRAVARRPDRIVTVRGIGYKLASD